MTSIILAKLLTVVTWLIIIIIIIIYYYIVNHSSWSTQQIKLHDGKKNHVLRQKIVQSGYFTTLKGQAAIYYE